MVDYLNIPKARIVVVDVPLYKRLFSFLIDYLVVDFFIISYFVKYIENIVPFNLGIFETFNFIKVNPALLGELSFLIGVLGVLIMIYFVYSQKVLTQTVGMRLMKIKLVNEDKKKNDVEFWQIIVRNLFLIPLFPFIFFLIVDPIYLMIYNRKFSDVLAKLRLVEEKAL